MQIPDIWQLIHEYQKEVTIVVVTAACTLVFSRLLPLLGTLAGTAISALWALVTGKHRYHAFEKEYLKWLINENRYMTMVPSEVESGKAS